MPTHNIGVPAVTDCGPLLGPSSYFSLLTSTTHLEPLFLTICSLLEKHPFNGLILFHGSPYSYSFAQCLSPGTSFPYMYIHTTASMIGLLFYPEDGGNTFLQNNGKYLPGYTSSYPRSLLQSHRRKNVISFTFLLRSGIWLSASGARTSCLPRTICDLDPERGHKCGRHVS
jgi:hypothetical protein